MTPTVARDQFEALLQKGASLSQQADYPDAIPILREATKLVPRHYLANLLLGVDLLRSGRPAEAINPLKIATEVKPDDPTAMGYLGEAHTALGDFASAAESFQAAVSRAPHSDETLLGWADFGLERFRAIGTWLRGSPKGTAVVLRVQAEGMEDGTKARESFLRQSAESGPEQPGIWGELGVAQVQLGFREAAENSLKIAKERQPDASNTHQLEALMDAASGNWADAEKQLQALAKRSPASLKRALAAWPRILLPDPVLPDSLWQCVRERSATCTAAATTYLPSEYKSTNQIFSEERWEQLAAMPSTAFVKPDGWFQRGVAFAQLGNCAQAIPLLERGFNHEALNSAFWLEICYGAETEQAAVLLQSQGNDAAIHELRGDMLLRMKGDPAAAVSEYQQAQRLRPRDPDLSERLAQAFLAAGDLPNAKAAANQAVAVDAHRMLALRLLVLANMSDRDYREALAQLQKMQAMDPESPWVRAQMGTAYAQTGQPEEAVRYLQPVLSAGYPDEKGALHAMLAGALRKLGREEEAKNAAAEASRLANSFQGHGQTSSDDHQ